MKFHPLAAVAVLALAVAACHEAESPTPPDDVVTVPDETPDTPPRPGRDPCGKTKDGTACP